MNTSPKVTAIAILVPSLVAVSACEYWNHSETATGTGFTAFGDLLIGTTTAKYLHTEYRWLYGDKTKTACTGGAVTSFDATIDWNTSMLKQNTGSSSDRVITSYVSGGGNAFAELRD